MSHCNKKMLSFFLTTKCNLCCRYCYNAQERNSIKEYTLPIEIAKSGIDWYFANNVSRHIRFYGPGEATQEFSKMKKITEYAKAHKNAGNKVTVEIQTNGVFTEEVRNWSLENIDIMWISFDGMREIQNYNRPINPQYSTLFRGRTSAEVLEDNIRWLIRNKGIHKLMVGARATITAQNVSKQREMIDYFYELGIRYVWTDPLFYTVEEKPVCEDYVRQSLYNFDMDMYLENYLEAYEYAKRIGMFWGTFLAVNFDGESSYHCRCCTPLNAPHLTPDGYISSCDMVVLGSSPHHMSPFIIGQWNSKVKQFVFDYDKINALNKRKSIEMEHCKDCPVKLHCGGYCLGEILNETGNLYGQNKIKCKAIVKLFEVLGPCEPYKYMHP